MDCEACRHPLALHDPCSAARCRCMAYQPADRKERVAMLTDLAPRPPKIADVRAAEKARLA